MMPLVVHGESGVGKTSLIAKVVVETQDNNKDKNVAILFRFCGTTPDSSTGMLSIILATVEGQRKYENELWHLDSDCSFTF